MGERKIRDKEKKKRDAAEKTDQGDKKILKAPQPCQQVQANNAV